MEVIVCCRGNMCEDGIISALTRFGITVIKLERDCENVNTDKTYLNELIQLLQDHPQAACVFSMNYMPIVAKCCKTFRILYLSWTADSPSMPLYSDTIRYETNRIFLFDRMQWEKFSPENPDCIFHLPLAGDVSGWDVVQVTDEDHVRYDCDVSFVGSLYAKDNLYDSVEEKLSPKMQGYAEALINAQLNVYGYNLLEDSISEAWAMRFKKHANWGTFPVDYTEDVTGIVADTYLGQKCTQAERIRTLNALGARFEADVWTTDDPKLLTGVQYRGVADSRTMMPRIFKCSKINLNITSRSIKTGIPLRIFDILACGGFVLSNYQAEIPEFFVPGEEIVLYESIPDMLDKITYYLEHEEERLRIAQNGYERVKELHTYDVRLAQMFETSGIL